jgi:hypothetical protein
MAPSRAAKRASSEQSWRSAVKLRFRRRASGKKRLAAVDGARDDIIDWLSAAIADSPPTVSALTAELVTSIGDVISGEVFDALSEELKTGNHGITKKELAEKHLFCALLAAISQEIQQINSSIDAAVERITASLVSYCVGRSQLNLPSALVAVVARAAAMSIEKLIATLPPIRHLGNLQQAAEIVAFLACPAPEKHEAVIRYCVRPLGEPIVSGIVLTWLI